MDIESISALVAAASVIVGVVLAYLEIKSLVRTRQTELVTSIYSSVSTRARRRGRNLCRRKSQISTST